MDIRSDEGPRRTQVHEIFYSKGVPVVDNPIEGVKGKIGVFLALAIYILRKLNKL